MNAMKAVTQNTYGGPERLAIAAVERPAPGPIEVLVEVRAAGISPGDRAMLTGVPYVNRLAGSGLRRPRHPIPGFDCAGVVAEVGDEVTRLAVGDRVFGNAAGSFAEYAIATQDELATMPDGWTFEAAAAIPESACVALQAVCDHGGVDAGDGVAVVGAGGGVGCYAVQIAKAAGARVTGVCGTRMLASVKALGADDVLDYEVAGLAQAARRFDVIIDAAGKDPLRHLRRALTQRGKLVIVGADHGHKVTGGLGRWIRALFCSPFVPQRLRPIVARPLGADHLERLVELMEHGQLQACIDSTFPLADVADAMRRLDHRQRPGKVVVTRDLV